MSGQGHCGRPRAERLSLLPAPWYRPLSSCRYASTGLPTFLRPRLVRKFAPWERHNHRSGDRGVAQGRKVTQVGSGTSAKTGNSERGPLLLIRTRHLASGSSKGFVATGITFRSCLQFTARISKAHCWATRKLTPSRRVLFSYGHTTTRRSTEVHHQLNGAAGQDPANSCGEIR
jgi:hypothetical protein